MVPKPLRLLFGLSIALLLVGGPLAYRSYVNRHYRNFRIVTPGVLYRSAQLTLPGFQRLLHDYRFKTVICLRNGEDEVDQAEEAYCREAGVKFVRIPPRTWGPVNGIVPVEEALSRFREVMDDPARYPVLLHCFAGTHRTGAYVAVHRMEYEGWDNARAIQELRSLGYVTLDGDLDVLEFLTRYERHGKDNPIRTVSQQKSP